MKCAAHQGWVPRKLMGGLSLNSLRSEEQRSQKDPPLETLLVQGASLFEAGRLSEAAEVYATAVSLHGFSAPALIRLADISLKQGGFQDAEAHLSRLRRESPDFEWTPLIEGELAMALGQFARAADLFAEAATRMPGFQPVASRREQALAMYRRERDWTAPVELQTWPSAQSSAFLDADPRDRVLVVSWDIAHNVVGRGITLAETICGARPTALAGPMFPAHGETLWAPLALGDRKVPIAGWRAPFFRHLLEGALRLVREWPAGTVWVSKPRFPGMLIGLIYKQVLGARVICDVDDDELAFVNGEEARDLDSFLAALGPQDWMRPQGRFWTELGLGILPFVDAVTACNPVLCARHGATLVRHGRSLSNAQAAVTRRNETRLEFGFLPSDKVVLFLGTPRRHKGIIELAQAVVALDRPDVVLCVVGSSVDMDMERQLTSMPGLRLRRLEEQPFSRVLDLNAIADIVVLLQDRSSKIALSQTPAKLTDALAVGTPVLITDLPPVEDFIAADAAIPIREGDDLAVRLAEALALARPQDNSHPFFLQDMSHEANCVRAVEVIDAAHALPARKYPDAERLLSFLRREMPGVLPADLTKLCAPHLSTQGPLRDRIDPSRPVNVAFFWKQNDSSLYGRRQDMLLRELSRRPEIGRILHIDAPIAATDLFFQPNPMRPSPETDQALISANTLARLAGLSDEGNIHRRSLVTGQETHTLLGRKVPGTDSFANAVEFWLEDLEMRDNCIAWVCPVVPSFEDVQRRLRFPFVLSDYIDDQRFWSQSPTARRQIDQNYSFMAEVSDVAIANCQTVADSLTRSGLSPILVPNGIDTRAQPPEPAAEILRLAGPVIGYCGNMNDRFDFDLVEALALARPNYRVVLIGKLSNPKQHKRMASLPNVHVLGIRTYEQARACIAAFDVAIVPHERSLLSDHMNPLKVYVYRSLGVPVVSTSVRNVDDFRDDILFADGAVEFALAIDASLARLARDGRHYLPDTICRAYSWENRMEAIWGALARGLDAKFG